MRKFHCDIALIGILFAIYVPVPGIDGAHNNNVPSEHNEHDFRSKLEHFLGDNDGNVRDDVSHVMINTEGPAGSVLPIQISVDRCYDTQWSPPGHPTLNVSYLVPPYFDWGEYCRAGYYSFETDENGNITRFVRIFEDNSGASVVLPIYNTVDFLVVSDDVLFFNGLGVFGTLIQGSNIPASDSDASYDTVPVEESDITPTEWLLKNFGDSEDSAVCP